MITGTSRSVRIVVGWPPIVPAMSMPASGSPSGAAAAAPAVDQEPVELVGQGLHAVGVGGEREGGLRLADGQQALDVQVAQRAGVARGSKGPGDLGVEVVGEGVAGVAQIAVALGVEGGLQALCRRP
jgi:hypothetical protein